jgi:hypothetical protein
MPTLAEGPHILTLRPAAEGSTFAIDALIVAPQTITAPLEPTAVIPVEPTQDVVVPAVEPTVTPQPVVIPFTDAFDSGTGWTVTGTWRSDLQTAQSGASWFADASLRGQSSTLELGPAIILGSAVQPQLTFWQKSSLTSGDMVIVEVSVDNGLSWMPIDQQLGTAADWTQHTVDLSMVVGQTIRLRFRLDTTGVAADGAVSVGLWIDNLLIQDTPPPTPTVDPADSGTVEDIVPETAPAQ